MEANQSSPVPNAQTPTDIAHSPTDSVIPIPSKSLGKASSIASIELATKSKRSSVGSRSPSVGRQTPSVGAQTPSVDRQSQSLGAQSPSIGTRSPDARSPSIDAQSPSLGERSPVVGSPSLTSRASRETIAEKDDRIRSPSMTSISKERAGSKTSIQCALKKRLSPQLSQASIKSKKQPSVRSSQSRSVTSLPDAASPVQSGDLAYPANEIGEELSVIGNVSVSESPPDRHVSGQSDEERKGNPSPFSTIPAASNVVFTFEHDIATKK